MDSGQPPNKSKIEDFRIAVQNLPLSEGGKRKVMAALMKAHAEFIETPRVSAFIFDERGRSRSNPNFVETWRIPFRKTFDAIAGEFFAEGKLTESAIRGEILGATSDAGVLGRWHAMYVGRESESVDYPLKIGSFWMSERSLKQVKLACESCILEWTAKLREVNASRPIPHNAEGQIASSEVGTESDIEKVGRKQLVEECRRIYMDTHGKRLTNRGLAKMANLKWNEETPVKRWLSGRTKDDSVEDILIRRAIEQLKRESSVLPQP